MIPEKVKTARDLVGAASPKAAVISLRGAAGRIRRWHRWLNKDHPYNDVIRALRNRNSEVDERKIGEYIACSAPLHLTDGWNYLSRAFCAASQGDQHVAYPVPGSVVDAICPGSHVALGPWLDRAALAAHQPGRLLPARPSRGPRRVRSVEIWPDGAVGAAAQRRAVRRRPAIRAGDYRADGGTARRSAVSAGAGRYLFAAGTGARQPILA